MNINRINAIIYKGFVSLRKDVFRLFDIFYWPAFQLLTWGLFSIFIEKTNQSGINITSLLLGGIILWTFFDRASKDISLAMIDELWNKNFINIFSTPLRISEYIIGISAIALLKLVVSTVFMFIFAELLYGFQIRYIGLYIVPSAIGLTIFGWSLSLFVQSCILRFGHTVEVFIWAVATLVQPLSCVFYPVSVLPRWAQYIAYALPSTYLFENMRSAIAGKSINTWEIGISVTLNILYFVFAALFFKRSFEYSKKVGLLIKSY